MKTFKLYWLTGKEEIVQGKTIEEAFTHAGYGAGAVKALDYYEEVKIEDFKVRDFFNIIFSIL